MQSQCHTVTLLCPCHALAANCQGSASGTASAQAVAEATAKAYADAAAKACGGDQAKAQSSAVSTVGTERQARHQTCTSF